MEKYFSQLEKLFFPIFHGKRQKKLKKYSVAKIVLTFHRLNNLFQCNSEFFQGTEAKKSDSQKHYKFLAFCLEFAKLFLESLFLASVPWKNSKLHLNKFFSQHVRTIMIMVTKYHSFVSRYMKIKISKLFHSFMQIHIEIPILEELLLEFRQRNALLRLALAILCSTFY